MNTNVYVIYFVPRDPIMLDVLPVRVPEGSFAGIEEINTAVDRLAAPAEVIQEVEAMGLPYSDGCKLYVQGQDKTFWENWVAENHDLFKEDVPINIVLAPQMDWVREYMSTVKPFYFAKKFWIFPSWFSVAECPPGKLPLQIDPSMAFGTGEHETTQTCAEAIEEFRPTLSGFRALDLGCGSGILALVLDREKMKEVVCVDNDPLSLEHTEQAFKINTHRCKLEIKHGETGSDLLPMGKFDMIVANILLSAILDYIRVFPKISTPNSVWIFSGILDSQEEEVRQAAISMGGVYQKTFARNEWRTIVFRFP